ncbi:ABC transporter substrate-binding protein [Nocardia sp. 852002-20019_SCH5090214]|uniref:ABC transporter substrate-binding protein n=1 Tax=Nocardia TaxID=1817 RepID=UPI0007E94319|nr:MULTISPECIES: ABC transporter substrate-binding protein [Nocardia]OBA42716.1 ABC transporter substrate-binding protein [Nocardia sp. 852002-20019_SCH5090214]PPJ07152.1 ABC transporter substrate-binding protein [Nocardia nova]
MKYRRGRILAAAALIATLAAGCSLEQTGSGDTVRVVVGYQSKTINTVTAGTLLRAKGFLENRLNDLTAKGGPKYQVEWQDYDTGAPITAQMIAEKIDIGSMGDYPLLINGSRTSASERSATELVSITGYQPRGSLNMVVTAPNSTAMSLSDLAGKKVSASVGSAGDGTLRQALSRANIDPAHGVDVLNQQPQIGASALESGQVQALSQFVAWPGLLVFQDKAKLLYDGAELNVPTFHGVVARRDYSKSHPEVLDAFLQAQLDATDFLHAKPLEAAQLVADNSGLPAEVVYLYNGPGGTSFDTPLKPQLVQAFKGDVPYLKSIGDFADFDIDKFVDDAPLRKAFAERGVNYEAAVANFADPAPITGTDPSTGKPVSDAALAGEIWFDGQAAAQPAGNPTDLLRAVKAARAQGKKVRAAYVPDAELGTRWFADKAQWVREGDTYLPFITPGAVQRYQARHPGAVAVSYDQAIGEVRS